LKFRPKIPLTKVWPTRWTYFSS